MQCPLFKIHTHTEGYPIFHRPILNTQILNILAIEINAGTPRVVAKEDCAHIKFESKLL